MKKMRKIISLIVALAFLFSLAAPAMAAEPTAAEKAGNRLLSLELIAGYTDGTLGLDKQITRAEIAVILAKSAGMGAAADLLKDTPSKFSDVKAGEWYTGWVNLAASQGWVKGDPQGTFRPNDPVSYREIVTMLMKVLGYNDNLPGDWPVDYLAKAAALEITKGLVFDAKAAAVRGDVFRLASKTIDATVVSYDKDNDEFDAKKDNNGNEISLLADKILDNDEQKGQVKEIAIMLGSNLKEDQVKIGSKTYDVAKDVNVNAFLGDEVKFLLNDDDEIVYIQSSSDYTVVEDAKVYNSVYSAGELELELNDGGDKYDITADTLIIKDYKSANFATFAANDSVDNMAVKLFVDEDENVKAAVITDWRAADAVVVDKVDAEDKEIEGKVDINGGVRGNYDDEDYNVSIIKGGALVSYADIKANDLVYEFVDGDDYVLEVVSNSVEGAVEKINSKGDKLTVKGTSYGIFAGNIEYSKDNGDTFTATVDDLLGENALAIIGGNGEIVAVIGDVENDDNFFYAIAYDFDAAANDDRGTKWIKLFKDGDDVTYDFAKGAEDFTGSEFGKAGETTWAALEGAIADGTFVKVQLDDNGAIKKLGYDAVANDAVDASFSAGGKLTADNQAAFAIGDPEKEYNRVAIAAGVFKYITDDTLVFDVSTASDPEKATWGAIEEQANFNGTVYYNDKAEIVAIVSATDLDAADSENALFVSYFKTKDGYNYTFFIDGQEKTFVTADSSDLLKGTGIRTIVYDFDGDGTEFKVDDSYEAIVSYKLNSDGELTDIVAYADQSVYGKLDKDISNNIVTIDKNGVDTELRVSDSTVIIDNTGDSPRVVSASSLKGGYKVFAYYKNTGKDAFVAKYIVIQSKNKN